MTITNWNLIYLAIVLFAVSCVLWYLYEYKIKPGFWNYTFVFTDVILTLVSVILCSQAFKDHFWGAVVTIAIFVIASAAVDRAKKEHEHELKENKPL